MIKMLFTVTVMLLLFILVANLVAFMMPVLTHPIATIIFIGFFVLFAVRLVKASDR